MRFVRLIAVVILAASLSIVGVVPSSTAGTSFAPTKVNFYTVEQARSDPMADCMEGHGQPRTSPPHEVRSPAYKKVFWLCFHATIEATPDHIEFWE
jgi:hypothetical protein